MALPIVPLAATSSTSTRIAPLTVQEHRGFIAQSCDSQFHPPQLSGQSGNLERQSIGSRLLKTFEDLFAQAKLLSFVHPEIIRGFRPCTVERTLSRGRVEFIPLDHRECS